MPTSSMVLASQRMDLKDVLYDAAKARHRAKETAVNPLVVDSRKLIPSVTRVFSRSRPLYVYLQAAAAGRPFVGFVSLTRGGHTVYVTQAQFAA